MTDHLGTMVSLPLFSTFTKDALRSWLGLYNYSIQSYSAGSAIFNEGEICTSIFVVLEGQALIQKIDSSGRYLNVAYASVGELMGPNVLFSEQKTYPLSTLALTNVTVVSLSKDLVLKLCQVNSHFLESLLKVTSSKAFLLAKRLDEVTVQTLRQNITRFLLAEAEKSQSQTIQLPFTKKDWAAGLGVQRPSLQRELKNLEDLGYILVNKDLIQILHRPMLEKLAEE